MSQVVGLVLILIGGFLILGVTYLPQSVQSALAQVVYCFGVGTPFGCGGFALTAGTLVGGISIFFGGVMLLQPPPSQPQVIVVKEGK